RFSISDASRKPVCSNKPRRRPCSARENVIASAGQPAMTGNSTQSYPIFAHAVNASSNGKDFIPYRLKPKPKVGDACASAPRVSDGAQAIAVHDAMKERREQESIFTQ